MTSFTFYCTYIQLKTEQSMYSINSGIQWFQFAFFYWWAAVVTQETTLLIRRRRVVRTVGPANFKEIERAVSGLNHLDMVADMCL